MSSDSQQQTQSNRHSDPTSFGSSNTDSPPNTDTSTLRNVYISSLPLTYTSADLLALARPYGTIVEQRVFCRSKAAQKTRQAYGFVLFKSPDAARRAVAALHNKVIEDRHIKCYLRKHRNKHVMANSTPQTATLQGSARAVPAPVPPAAAVAVSTTAEASDPQADAAYHAAYAAAFNAAYNAAYTTAVTNWQGAAAVPPVPVVPPYAMSPDFLATPWQQPPQPGLTWPAVSPQYPLAP